MKIERTERGFEKLLDDGGYAIVRQSSAIGDYPDAFDKPGSSFLWIDGRSLSRSQVAELTAHLHHWLMTGSLEKPA